MSRNEAERRHFDEVKTARNVKILRFRWDAEDYEANVIGQEHRYAYNKVFCSCPLCAFAGTTRQEAKQFDRTDCDYFDDDYFDDDDDFDYASVVKGRNRDAVRRNAF